jgi:hypothetical protein
MAYNPLNLSPFLPVETPITDSAQVDMSQDIPSIAQTSKTFVLENKANELDHDEIVDWFHKLSVNLKFRRNHWNGVDSWLRFKRLYAGFHLNVWRKNPSLITVNTAYAVIRSIVPELYFNDPYFYVEPTKDSQEFQAAITEHVLNHEWKKKIKGKRTMRRCILDYGIFGWAVARTGYRFLSDVAKNLIKDGEIEFERQHELEEIFVSRVSPFNYLWDFVEASHPDESQWVAELRIRSYEDVKADARYKNVESIKSSAMPKIGFTTLETEGGSKYYGSFVDTQFQSEASRTYIFEWTITDKKFGRTIVLAEGNEESALRMIDTPFNQVPYDHLFIDEIPDEPFPISPIGAIEDQILERDRIRTKQFQYWKRFTRKYKVRKNSMDPNSMTQLKRGDDGTVVQLNQLDDLDVIIDPPMSNDILVAEGAARSDIIEVVGVTPPQSAGSATKDRFNQIHETLRSSDRRAIVVDFMSSVAYKIVRIIRAEYTFERIIKISGGQLGSFWVVYDRNDISEDPDITIDVGEMTPEDPALLRKQNMDLYIAFRGDPNVNTRELARRAFKSFPNMRDLDSMFVQDTMFENPIFQLMQRQASGQTTGGMRPEELMRLFKTLMASSAKNGLPPAQVAPPSPNSPMMQAHTPGNFLKTPPIQPGSAEGNISNLRNRGING